MTDEENTVIDEVLRRRTTAPFVQWVFKLAQAGDIDEDHVARVGFEAGIRATEVQDSLDVAREYAVKGIESECKRIFRRPSPVAGPARKKQLASKKRAQKGIEKVIDAIIRPFGFYGFTESAIRKALLETWQRPERYWATPAWRGLFDAPRTDAE